VTLRLEFERASLQYSATDLMEPTDDVLAAKKKILAFGVKEVSSRDKSHLYFQAPGGQVFSARRYGRGFVEIRKVGIGRSTFWSLLEQCRCTGCGSPLLAQTRRGRSKRDCYPHRRAWLDYRVSRPVDPTVSRIRRSSESATNDRKLKLRRRARDHRTIGVATVTTITHSSSKKTWILLLALTASAPLPALGMAGTPGASDERAVHAEVIVNASQSEVWKAWSTNEGAENFFAPKTNIDVRIGGPYEIFFNPADIRQSTTGMKVLSYIPGEMLSFEWSLPKDEFPQFKDVRGWVVVQLSALSQRRTRVRVTHLGWGRGPDWDRAFDHMNRGWAELTQRLAVRFERGPMNWETQQMMWKERGK
jgi:uncharacterized protein YndB with AHSA1/START domain